MRVGRVKCNVYAPSEEFTDTISSEGCVSQSFIDEHLVPWMNVGTRVEWDEDLEVWMTEDEQEVPERFVRELI